MTPRKILVIEDSDLLQKGYSLLFQRYRRDGCEVLRAMNGREGLDALARHPDCDLIILDINMPVMSGLEFLQHFKMQPAFSRVPVIISSTEDGEDDIVRGLEAGATAYLVKPFSAEELHELIGKIMATGNRRSTLTA